jgi:predicted Zn-dependent protease
MRSAENYAAYEIILNISLLDDPNYGYSEERKLGIICHEFGHALGLQDLTSSSNQTKLMYQYSNTRSTSPTSSDVTGARAIWDDTYQPTSSGN